MIFRYDKKLLFLLIILLVSSVYFSISHYVLGGSHVKIIVLIVLMIFVLFNLLSILKRKVEVKDEVIIVHALLGTKQIKYNEIKDAVFLYLKGRTVLILADDEKFVFLSSVVDGFEKIIDLLKEKVSEDIKEKLALFDYKRNNKSKKLLFAFLIIAIIFFFTFGTLNFFTRF
ncbi:hypothetical protein FHQ18_00650 [Deferribacter autotrophicus]|uniref:Uncharacterized protein n=1 Tax=Deferribacter autotrophicus TaxID=500465 RepID=A0A5A8F8Y9_9BACT|nr:hypothetical protein [Deferribacter autotrophicus]KAA0259421.1 hypothetical protein FHQ18_00650 [Deferribacter autotrophicus]